MAPSAGQSSPLVAQIVKNLLGKASDAVSILESGRSLEEEMATH